MPTVLIGALTENGMKKLFTTPNGLVAFLRHAA